MLRTVRYLMWYLQQATLLSHFFWNEDFHRRADPFPVVMKTAGDVRIPRFSAPWVALGDSDVY